MKIASINNFISPYKIFPNRSEKDIAQNNQNFRLFQYPSCDTVSFSAKKYDSEQIQNPTYHCAYCGCKVYNKQQIDSIAKEILSSKYDKAEGKIKSVLEKLTAAKNSEELTFDKRISNQEQIKFFENLLELCENKSYLKCSDVLKQVRNLDSEEALNLIVKNLRPLTATIDHVSPQNLEQENKDADINLVEACYCCNHDIKNGLSFADFYDLYPSIKYNMPKDKFKYAKAQILDEDQDNVSRRISAASVLKRLHGLFEQRTQLKNETESVDLSIRSFDSKILSAIQGCQENIDEKQAEIDDKQAKLDSYKDDNEYNAMLLKLEYEAELNSVNQQLGQATQKRGRLSNAINEIKNPKKKKEKQKAKDELSEEEKKEKITEYRTLIEELTPQIEQLTERKDKISSQIAGLDEQFPPYDVVQRSKAEAEQIINAHIKTNQNIISIRQKEEIISQLNDQRENLIAQTELLPKEAPDAKNFPDDVVQGHKQYTLITMALSHINQHPNSGATNLTIFEYAKKPLEDEAESLLSNPMVDQEIKYKHKVELDSEVKRIDKILADHEKEVTEMKLENQRLAYLCEKMSQDEAEAIVKTSSETLRRLQDKINDLSLPKRIEVLKSEIQLLEETISDLSVQLEKIHSEYPKANA